MSGQGAARKEQWTCTCANSDCEGTWTSDTDELKCPFCGGENVLCAKDEDNDSEGNGNNDNSKKYDCGCPHCGHTWISSTEFPECPKCGRDDSECNERK